MFVSGSNSNGFTASSEIGAIAAESTTVKISLIKNALSGISEGFEALQARLFTKAGAAALVVIGVTALLYYKFSVVASDSKSVPSASATSSVFGNIIRPLNAAISYLPFISTSASSRPFAIQTGDLFSDEKQDEEQPGTPKTASI